ncbi:hypothetical protein HQ602_16005 [Rhodococcus kroppenstedtii]|uniref:hypothetical protein n=1 Tax=Rhodococcoides kroppenstedtii TaxID=293050 RepID=UPI001C9ADF88|nr:hypothetical protein [Rhodococcus kroppenstedtii]MBY6437886.1 hypothetical protein [Rhodococcus kroppenstedtii]
MAPIDDPVHRGDVPPPIDLAGHMKELGRAVVPALLIALLVGAGVYGLRAFATEKQYAATVTTEIVPSGEVIPGDAFIEQLRAPFIGLAADNDVLQQVVSQTDTGWTAAELASHLELAPGTSPALLDFTVTADSPEQALDVARTTVTTVAQAAGANAARDSQSSLEQVQASIAAEEARIAQLIPGDPSRTAAEQSLTQLRDQATQLQTTGSGDRLMVLAVPEPSDTPVSPLPVSEASVAAIAAFIVAAELIVLIRSRIGRKPRRAWARRIARKYRARFDPTVREGLPPVVAAAVATAERGNGSSARHARHGSSASILVLVGDDARYPAPMSTGPDGHARHPDALVGADLTGQWWTYVDASSVDTAVVLVSEGGSDRKAAEAALRRLSEFQIPTHLVVQPAGSASRPAPASVRRPDRQVEDNAQRS